MSLIINGNAKIASLDFDAQFNLITGNLLVTMTPTQWLAGGNNTVTSGKLAIVSPSGQVIADGTVLSFVPPMDQQAIFALPTINGIYEWGNYQFRLTLDDGAGNTYVLNKAFNLCAPFANDLNTGNAVLRMDADCDHAVMKVYGANGYAYKGKDATSWALSYTFYYPADSGVLPLAGVAAMPAQFTLYSGMNKISGNSDGTFSFEDQFSVVVRFSGEESKYVQCNFPCHIWCAYEQLVEDVAGEEVGSHAYERLYEKLLQVQIYVPLVLIGIRCNKNIDRYLDMLEEILGVKNCPCSDVETVQLGATVAPPPLGAGAPPNPVADTPPGTTTTTTTQAPGTTTTTTTQAPAACPEVSDIQGGFDPAPTTTTTTEAPGTTTTTTQPPTTTTTTRAGRNVLLVNPSMDAVLNIDGVLYVVHAGVNQNLVLKNGSVISSSVPITMNTYQTYSGPGSTANGTYNIGAGSVTLGDVSLVNYASY